MGDDAFAAQQPSTQERDARLRIAMEAAGLATWDVELESGVALWSATHFHLLGYPVDPSGYATYQMWHSRLHPDDRDRVLDILARAKATRSTYHCEHRIVRADNGEVVWIEPHGRFFYDENGRATRLVGVCLETTARREAEDRLLQRETQLELATRIVGIGVFEHDHLRNKLYWSDQFREIHDLPRDVEPDFGFYEPQLHPDDRASLDAAIRAAHDPRGNGTFHTEYRVRRHNGETRWIVARAQTFFEGEGAQRRAVRTVGAELDVTDRKRIEMDLRDSEARFRTMADGSPVMIWATNARNTIEFVNTAYCRFFGVTLESVQRDGWQPTLHPEDALRYESAFADAAARRASFQAQARVQRANGDWRWIETYATPRIGPDGEFLGYVGVTPDVTALVEAQSALRKADQRKDEFLATLAHELRNPLAPIRTAAHMLTLPKLGNEELMWARQVIHRQVEHMARLLDDLLDVARITRGKLQLKKERVDLASVVDTAVEAARPLIASRKHRLTIELPPQVPALDADPVRLAQVLSNLLTNAAKYTDPPGRIALTARVESGALRISVSDTGIGLSPAARAHIFEMFSQVQDERGRSEGGLGIGLALVKGLVDLHGGRIEAFSDGPGKGSEFVVTVPLASGLGMVQAISSPRDEAKVSLGCRRIVVADDNQDAANSLAMLLRAAGHEVWTAHGGQAALNLASTYQPDVGLLDIGMPDLNGYEVARQIRAAPWGRGMQLIALTGWGQDEDKRRALAAGFDHHLTKPIDIAKLERLLLGGAAQSPAA